VAAIRVSRLRGAVCVEVRDAGKGISKEKHLELEVTGSAGVGITGMRERLRQVGGVLEISSSGNGTIVSARLPI
jgi:signal transduction histidine kinase